MDFLKNIFSKITLFTLCLELLEHISIKKKKSLFFLFLLTLICAVLEMFSMATVLPFLMVLTNPEKLFEYSFIENVFNFLGYQNYENITFFITVTFVVTIILSILMRVYLLIFTTRLSFGLGADFGLDIHKKTLYLPYINHISRNSSEVVNGIFTKVNQVIYGVVLSILTLLNAAVILTIMLVTILFIDLKITLVSAIVFFSLYVFTIFLVKLPLKKHSEVIALFSNNILKNLQEGLGGIKDIILSNSQEFHANVFRKDDLTYRNSQGSIHIISGTPRFLIEGLGIIFIALLGYFASRTNVGFIELIPILGLMVFAAQRMLPLLQQIYSSWSSIKSVENSLIDVLKLLESRMPRVHQLKNATQIIFEKSLILSNISFKYYNMSQNIFTNLNLEIKKGDMIGFVGETGSGKSTIIDIIMGLLIPSKGSMKVDGIILKKDTLINWQKLIAHVPQKIFLIDASILENIAFGVPKKEIDILLVKKVAANAEIIEYINSLPNGFFTEVGENGIRLSGGQQQRLAIARALYKEPEILVLDEATSALDSKTEKKIMNTILTLRKKLTIITVAHRISTLENYDVIYNFNKGEIQSMGKYEEFIKVR